MVQASQRRQQTTHTKKSYVQLTKYAINNDYEGIHQLNHRCDAQIFTKQDAPTARCLLCSNNNDYYHNGSIARWISFMSAVWATRIVRSSFSYYFYSFLIRLFLRVRVSYLDDRRLCFLALCDRCSKWVLSLYMLNYRSSYAAKLRVMYVFALQSGRAECASATRAHRV